MGFITLTIPQMEDGNNFGVTVQLALLKQITEAREKNDSAMEDLMKYGGSRAEALEKCKLPSVAVTQTDTVSESNSQENTEEKRKNRQPRKQRRSPQRQKNPRRHLCSVNKPLLLWMLCIIAKPNRFIAVL